MDKSIVIYQPWGGLGDNLAHSTLPEQCHKHGIKCYLSRQNAYRNDGIKKFVWDNNPYIDGEVDSTDLTWFYNVPYLEQPGKNNHIEAIQNYYGFSELSHYPKIYYTPKKINTYTNKTILDLSAYTIGKDYNPEKILKILKQFNLDSNTITLTHSSVNYGINYKTKYKQIDICSLEEYSDLLFSCERFITLHSGQACLASTIKFQTNSDIKIYVLTLNKFLPENSCGYTFKNTEYISCDQ